MSNAPVTVLNYTAVASTPRGHKVYAISEAKAGSAHVAQRAIRAMAAEDAGCSVLDVSLSGFALKR